jgi:hypothetical protein
MTLRPDDPAVLRAAAAAFKELSQREQDLLELLFLEKGTAEVIATANLISIERAHQWIDEARTRYREKLAIRLELAGIEREDLAQFLDVSDNFAVAVMRLVMETKRPEVAKPAPPKPVASCPKCGAGFHDPSGQFGTYAKLATEGRVALMLGCTACSLLFVPISQAAIATVLPGEVPKRKQP